ncbi:MAG: preprotein translocase subunit YajC [Pseudomonadales bacterium]|nr:preprotein translocase subunit YajC [Pseudomonadales bacterium]
MSIIISPAYAEGAAAGADGGMIQIVMLVGFGLIFYFFMWRPQAKRAKDHKNLVAAIEKGDEVMTSGGIIGKVVKLNDDYVTLEVSEGTKLSFQKVHIAAALPKGTMKNL